MIQKKGKEIKCLQFGGHNSTSLMGQNVLSPGSDAILSENFN